MTLQEEGNRVIKGFRRYPMETDLKIPIDDNSVQSIMKYNGDIYNSSYMNNTEWNSNIEVNEWLSPWVGVDPEFCWDRGHWLGPGSHIQFC